MMKKNVVIFVMSIFAMYVSAYEYKGSSNGCLERAPWQIADGNVEGFFGRGMTGAVEMIVSHPHAAETPVAQRSVLRLAGQSTNHFDR